MTEPRPNNAAGRPKRADAQRNERALLDAAASVFVRSGVDAPVRDIATQAGVGVGTIYRHFPTRAALVVAVYRHQIEACVLAGPELLASRPSPQVALGEWLDLFADFLMTKHGLAAALQSDDQFDALHAEFIHQLLPVCSHLLHSAETAGDIRAGIDPYHLMRAVGNLCIGDETDDRYDARAMVRLLVDGLRQP
jgi:AcrR family transcriptional regulator